MQPTPNGKPPNPNPKPKPIAHQPAVNQEVRFPPSPTIPTKPPKTRSKSQTHTKPPAIGKRSNQMDKHKINFEEPK